MRLLSFLQRLSPFKLFLIDSMGALLSAATGILISQFQSDFGIPENTLYILVGIATAFCLVSFSCFLYKPKNWQQWMNGIAIANISYCCVTAGLVLYLYPKLTALGLGFLCIEIILIVMIASAELKKAHT